ncbi:MAG TPA: 2-oxo acid dehydrogenase subunit E2, partial [Acidimicrobiia bacterium]|nr:2-oxo acid dehydrogenase subunit E2 [Acidimicrobiia bacterium]
MTDTKSGPIDPTLFGPNMWLVDEMFRQFVDDPESVSEAWQEFFEDYQPHSQELKAKTEDGSPKPDESRKTEDGSPARDIVALKGAAAVVAERMGASREIPTATSVRTIPAKLLEVNRLIINNQLKRLTQGGKVSFTHLIGWAIVRALRDLPDLNVAYTEVDGKPAMVRYPHVNLGLAIDMERKDGSRGLVVPNVKLADTLDFKQFWVIYEELVHRARQNRLTLDD